MSEHKQLCFKVWNQELSDLNKKGSDRMLLLWNIFIPALARASQLLYVLFSVRWHFIACSYSPALTYECMPCVLCVQWQAQQHFTADSEYPWCGKQDTVILLSYQAA